MSFFDEKPHVDYIMEEFIDGEIHTFDGIVDADGDISAMSSMHYGLGLMETVNYGMDTFFYIERHIPEDVIEMGEKVIINIKTFADGHRPPDLVVPSML